MTLLKDRTYEEKIERLAKVLASYFGMEKPTEGGRKHLSVFLKSAKLDKSALKEAMPAARKIVRERAQKFDKGSTTKGM